MIKLLLIAAMISAPVAHAERTETKIDYEWLISNGSVIATVVPLCRFGYQFLIVDGRVIQVYERYGEEYTRMPPQPMKCEE